MLLTVQSNQKTRDRQIGPQLQGKRPIPFRATNQEEKPGRDTLWELRAKEAPEPIKANWPGCSWIIEMDTTTTTTTRNGSSTTRRHLFLTSIRTTPETLLRLIHQRWSMENEWHWARDVQLGADAHRYAHRTGVAIVCFPAMAMDGHAHLYDGSRHLLFVHHPPALVAVFRLERLCAFCSSNGLERALRSRLIALALVDRLTLLEFLTRFPSSHLPVNEPMRLLLSPAISANACDICAGSDGDRAALKAVSGAAAAPLTGLARVDRLDPVRARVEAPWHPLPCPSPSASPAAARP